MLRFRLIGGSLLASAAIVGLSIVSAQAADDAFMTMAKDYVAKAAAPVTTWTGPTTGPKAQGGKLVIYVSADQKNGGAQGVGDGAQEAAKAIGWDFRVLDGQGAGPARSSALTQAIALKPAGVPGVTTNITTDPLEVAKAAGLYAVVDSGGKANVILFTDSIYAIATAKTNAEKEAVVGCAGCKVLSIEDTPIGDLSNRMGQLTTSLLSKHGKEWTYSIAVNDLYYDFSAPPLQAAGIEPAAGYPRQISAGDGSVPAFQRIRDKRYQIATVAEPLHLHGWQCIDELNRAFAAQPPSAYVAPVHLFTSANIDKDGGAQNIFDPGNGYKEQYKKIWDVK